jgi:4-alpha-glucanotransferase
MESRFDMVRIDHFRGLVQYWEVPAGEKTAERGQWQDVPTDDFIEAVRSACPSLRIVAEDLGIITDDVRDAMKRHGFPGMKILLFAFNNDDPLHPYLPHNYTRESVVYTGTHDNNTAAGWLRGEASEFERRRYQEYTGADPLAPDAVWGMVRLAMMSVSHTVVLPVQDLLGLGGEARMNTPSTPSGNWEWRLSGGELTPELAQRLSRVTALYGRAPQRKS